MAVRGIRGAVNIASNTKEEILTKSRELLEAILSANRVKPADIAAAIFTLSPDLNADFPAYAARQLGWTRHETAYDDLDVFAQGMAAMETKAHLELLVARGVAVRSEDADGVVTFAAAG